MTGGNGLVQDEIRMIQQRISTIEYNMDGQLRATVDIMGGRNEQEYFRYRNNNQSNYHSVCAVKFKRINSQVTTNGYDIGDLEPGNHSSLRAQYKF